MSFAERFEKTFHYLLPTPFTIAVILTLVTMILALAFGDLSPEPSRVLSLLDSWQNGLWNAPLLVFAVQMMLILVLGHTLALAPFVSRIIDRIIDLANSPAKAAYLVCFFTILVALFNWGLGLIFGAIMARKTGEHFARLGKKINYPLIGAAGYSGLMVWHGGISGSAPIKVNDEGHLQNLMAGIWDADKLATLPEAISFDLTVFGPMNLVTSMILLLILPLAMGWLASRSKGSSISNLAKPVKVEVEDHKPAGAEKLDYSKIFGLAFGALILLYALSVALRSTSGLGFITLNWVNLVLLGLCLVFHSSFSNFLKAIDEAIGGASGILIQFPLYFGIMGIMASAGLIEMISGFFISISNDVTFPIFTFFSAGIVNVFVPSGGGQWAVQGPIIIDAASTLGVDLPKSVMALAYGDQLTNMLQPFWALPLLGITGLKAREIIPYTLFLMLIGAIIFISVLLIF